MQIRFAFTAIWHYNGNMNLSPEFHELLLEAFTAKQTEIDKTTAPRLKENCSLLYSHFHAIYEMLLSKGVLRDDPYKNDRHLSDIVAPTDTFMSEHEVDDQMPIRLSEYDNLLDFLINFTAFNVQNLNLKRLKIILAIVKHINWTTLTPTSTQPTTRGLAVIMDKIRQGSDAVAIGVLNGNHTNAEKLSRLIQKDLKELADFQREAYKIGIRSAILPNLNLAAVHSKEDFLKVVKTAFPRMMPGEAFFPELVGELHDDLQNGGSESWRTQYLKRFHVEPAKKKVDVVPKVDLKAILLDGLRIVGTTSRHLDEACTKLIENNTLIKDRPRSFLERFKEWIVSLSGPKSRETVYTVEIIDVVSTMKRIEHIPFESFCNGLVKKSRSYASLASKNSSQYQRFEAGTEDDCYEFLSRTHRELRDYDEKLEALDLYFKTEIPASERNRLRGIKTELTSLRNGMVNINQKIHEYIARKEEQEQLRKLGIQTGE